MNQHYDEEEAAVWAELETLPKGSAVSLFGWIKDDSRQWECSIWWSGGYFVKTGTTRAEAIRAALAAARGVPAEGRVKP